MKLREALEISQIEVFQLRILLKGSFRNSRLARNTQDSIVLKILTADGSSGVGNVDPDPGYSEQSFADTLAAVRTLARHLIGCDSSNIVLALAIMDRTKTGCPDAKAALEMALCDVAAKRLGIPVYSLLGGKLRDELSLNGWIGILSPDEAAREAARWLARGFASAKIKVGSGVDQDRDRVKAVREAVGNKMTLRVDANEAYDVGEAIRLGKALRPFDLFLFEQPVPRRDINGMARVRRAIDIPVMADETILGPETLIEVAKHEAADIVKVKVMKQGGMHRTAQMIRMAESLGLKCVIGHGFGLAIHTLAEIHVAASCGNIVEGCEFVGPLKMEQDVVKNPLVMEKGKVAVPDRPGLGADLDHEKLTACIQT